MFWNRTYEIRAKQINLSKHEVVTLASIIEGEAIFNNERPKISAVYHNRLNINMKLQADPTIQFIINEPPRRLLNKDLKINSPYNTYLNKGLPPGLLILQENIHYWQPYFLKKMIFYFLLLGVMGIIRSQQIKEIMIRQKENFRK